MRIVPLPPNAELEKLLAGLVMREVRVKATEAMPGKPAAVALYRTDVPMQEVAVVCELGLAASLAAALSVVPPGAVKEAVAAGRMEASLQDNLAEVMNVLSRFVSGSGRRYGLVHSWAPPEVGDAKVLDAVQASDEVRAAAVEVPGYLGGLLAFYTL
jgi:hypothetical protein